MIGLSSLNKQQLI